MRDFRIKPSVSLLMIWRVQVQRDAGYAAERYDKLKRQQLLKLDAELSKEVRKKLRTMGFVRDCEIDMDMNDLALKARQAIDLLDCYLLDNSPVYRELVAKYYAGDYAPPAWQQVL